MDRLKGPVNLSPTARDSKSLAQQTAQLLTPRRCGKGVATGLSREKHRPGTFFNRARQSAQNPRRTFGTLQQGVHAVTIASKTASISPANHRSVERTVAKRSSQNLTRRPSVAAGEL